MIKFLKLEDNQQFLHSYELYRNMLFLYDFNYKFVSLNDFQKINKDQYLMNKNMTKDISLEFYEGFEKDLL